MNKKALIIILVLVIFITSLVVYFQNQKTNNITLLEQSEKTKREEFEQYKNLLLGIEFNYPQNFIPYLKDEEYIGNEPSRFVVGEDSYAPLGENSYFIINLAGVQNYECPSLVDPNMLYSGSYEDIQNFIQEGKPIKFENCKEIVQTIDEIAENSAYHQLLPFGENPIINRLEVEGQEARIIIPSDSNNNERELIVRLKNAILFDNNYWNFLIIHTSRDLNGEVIKTILESFHFI